MTAPHPFTGLAGLRGLRTAPALEDEQRRQLRQELLPLLAACGWCTVGIMAPSSAAALDALRAYESALGWPALGPAEEAEGAGSTADDAVGPVFLKGNQRNGLFRLRREDGLGEGVLITGHEATDPAAEDTWGPLPLDLFA
ncbi:DUF1824 family protein [Synechococcus sp. CCY 9618]|uniref:DUF1824 family protein n=1 Tax=Synechococcus sp. CCY 9618 TaxID=2815602 RepID=UPI001C24BAA2|nr:DUF1824 family protein [Synechococcus sp. CCY 9618]